MVAVATYVSTTPPEEVIKVISVVIAAVGLLGGGVTTTAVTMVVTVPDWERRMVREEVTGPVSTPSTAATQTTPSSCRPTSLKIAWGDATPSADVEVVGTELRFSRDVGMEVARGSSRLARSGWTSSPPPSLKLACKT
jgi:UPF0716 family protein affecting phage T7 exclusion